jgi:peptidoglycan/xylan/chitin deacetylase (PgdA/CDA1 family)
MDSNARMARRAERAAAVRRRRRRLGLVAVAVLVLVAGAVALTSGGGDGGGGSRQAAAPGVSKAAAKPRASTDTRSAASPVTPIGPQPGAHKAPGARVPVLMYHVTNDPPPGTAIPELWVSPRDLRAQVAALKQRGYHGVTLQQVYDAWHKGGELPSKPIVLSFDDGYTSHRSKALPILRAAGWPGVLNLQVDQTREDLKPPDVRALIKAGWEVDAHTFSHPDLTTVDAATLKREIGGARTALQRTFGVPVNFFCYPSGRYDQTVIAAVKAAGYLGATTTELGLASPKDDPYALRRIRVNRSDRVQGMLKNLQSAEGGATGGGPGADPSAASG